MIAKIITNNNLYGTLQYNHQKVVDGEARVLCVNEMWESATGEYQIKDFTRAFNMRLAKNNRTEKPIVHISLNPHPDDVLSDEQMVKIAQEYMSRMEFGEQPYVIFKHEDIERTHLHIVTTNLKPDGSKINDTNSKRRSKSITNDMEVKYKLHSADVKQDGRIWTPNKVELSKGRVRYQIRNITKHLLDSYKFLSLNEFAAALSLYNVALQEVKGATDNGAIYRGIIYSATDDAGNRISTPIKASNLGKDYQYQSIEKQVGKSLSAISTATKNAIKQRLSECIAKSSSQEELKQNLNERNIDVVFRRNEAGRIYGATIVDHNAKVVVNGSKLGKEFSANAFQSLLAQWANEPLKLNEAKIELPQEQEKEMAKNTYEEDAETTPILQESDEEITVNSYDDDDADDEVFDDNDFTENTGLVFAELLAGLFDVSVEPHHEKRFVPDKDDEKTKKKKRKKKQRL
jgi:hypothetical protein